MGIIAEAILVRALRSRSGFRSLLEGLNRCGRPILSFPSGKSHLVVGAAAVRDALRRPEDFLPGHSKGRSLPFGPFILGMNDTDEYRAQRAQLEEIVLKELDLGAMRFEMIAELTAERQTEQITRTQGDDARMDLVADYVDPVVYGTVLEFYGLPVGPDRPSSDVLAVRPGVETVAVWMRKLGLPILYSPPDPFGVGELAREVAREVRAYVLAALADSEGAASGRDGSLLAALFEEVPSGAAPAWRRDYEDRVFVRVAGLLVSGFALRTGLLFAIDEILQRPLVRDQVIELAHARDYDTLRLYIWEALRFRPTFPVMPRFVPRAVELRLGDGRVREIRAGSTLNLAAVAAMFDPKLVERPEAFLPSRFEKHAEELLGFQFGFPERQCLGIRLAADALPRFIGALFRMDALRGASPGSVQWDGRVIDRYRLPAGDGSARRAS